MKVAERVAVIGAGAMGEAFIRGLLRGGFVNREQLVATDKSNERRAHVEQSYGILVTLDNAEALRTADTAVVAVKPQNIVEALRELAPAVEPQRHLIISIAAGVPTSTIERRLPPGTPVVRAMPNIAALVGQAATALCKGTFAQDAHLQRALGIFEAIGRAVVVGEALMDAVTGLSGSGPAYAYLMIEALADGGVAAGLSREAAMFLAAQTLAGAARMVLDTGRHPAELRNWVTSPAGTTAAGLTVLESRGVRGALMEAVLAGTRRSRELGEAGLQHPAASGSGGA
ncbi:pyrroline-5-carboxylate reductase [Carboxydochorda subterranea]|uniref:Pyrroline-5-carboxylate reductase n=1 Tax=Carboxydichorda subterranea TaxID=3109565 RepID=A0ABZ1C0L7_9FIRM|nr:pyrroline-5-carboxylate reductase [Limnochorda sp. L945t]WRP18375.1 pyrroline-5-carboxylate reductase [Limnochorda sp. L945t]